MKTLKSKIKILLSLLLVLVAIGGPSVALADSCSCTTTKSSNGNCTGAVDQNKVNNCVSSTPIWKDIEMIINVLSAGVAVIVTGVIILAGIQYTMAGGNPQALQAARQRITNGLIALFVFLFTYAFLQWLVPGGIFNK